MKVWREHGKVGVQSRGSRQQCDQEALWQAAEVSLSLRRLSVVAFSAMKILWDIPAQQTLHPQQ